MLDPQIESTRVAAKFRVTNATTLAEVEEHANVDWLALIPQ